MYACTALRSAARSYEALLLCACASYLEQTLIYHCEDQCSVSVLLNLRHPSRPCCITIAFDRWEPYNAEQR
jgi:hypothetical protein